MKKENAVPNYQNKILDRGIYKDSKICISCQKLFTRRKNERKIEEKSNIAAKNAKSRDNFLLFLNK